MSEEKFDKAFQSKMNNMVSVTYKYTPDETQPEIIIEECENSNIVPINVISNSVASMEIKKSSARDVVTLGEYIKYAITFYNTGNVDLSAIKFRERIDNDSIYISKSIGIKNITSSYYNEDVILQEYNNFEEAFEDDIFDDYTRLKAAVYVRAGIENIVSEMTTNKRFSSRLTEDDKVLLTGAATTIGSVSFGNNISNDYLNISLVNSNYGRVLIDENLGEYERGEFGKLIKNIYDIVKKYEDPEGSLLGSKDLFIEFEHFFAIEALKVSKYLFTGVFNELRIDNSILGTLKSEEVEITPNPVIACNNILNVLHDVVNKLIDVSKNDDRNERKIFAKKNVDDLKSFIDEYFKKYIYLNDGEDIYDDTEVGEGKLKDNLTISSMTVTDEYISNKEAFIEMIDELLDIIITCLTNGKYLEVNNIGVNIMVLSNVIENFADNLQYIPEYEEEFNKPKASRLSKIWDVAKDSLAVTDTLLPYLYVVDENGKGNWNKNYIDEIKIIEKERNRLEVVLRALATHVPHSQYDEQASQISSVISNIYGAVKILSEKNIENNIANNLLIEEFKFMPVNSIRDGLDTDPQNNSGKNPNSPQDKEDDDLISVSETILNALKTAYNESSYVIIPTAARTFDYDADIDENGERNPVPSDARDIIINLNIVLPPENSGIISVGAHIGGAEEQIDEGNFKRYYSINYDANVRAMNANEIVNKVVAGFNAGKDGERLEEIDVVLPDDVNPYKDQDESEKNIYTEFTNPLKFAKLVVSKDAFVKDQEDNRYKPVTENGVKCGSEICYLVTIKNYGNIVAEDVTITDLLRTGLDFRSYHPTYNIDPNNLLLEPMEDYTLKVYDRNGIDNVNKYVTGLNNNDGEGLLKGYSCETETIAKKARKIGEVQESLSNGFAILTKNKYIEARKITVPAKVGKIEVEPNYINSEPQSDNNNDDYVGVVEFRLYYTINCSDIE